MKNETTVRRAFARRVDRLVIECVSPELDAGRFPVKRVVSDLVAVSADILKEGHDVLAAKVLYRGPEDDDWRSSPLAYDFDGDRWHGSFLVDRIGVWTFTVEAWTDVFGTWRSGLKKKVDAGLDVGLELLEGARLIETAARQARFGGARRSLKLNASVLEDPDEASMPARIERALDGALESLMREHAQPVDATRYCRELQVRADRERAGFAAWYEMFPRSQRADGRHGTFDDAAKRLPRLAELGWDVIYLAPIHPIGRTLRKGKNNSLSPARDDVGSPWAIGNEDGGHTAVEPALGTLADFESLVRAASRLGMEIALDYALQCSPDHPWVKEHPDWFHVRPDGSIQYAENPPKKYQDIYPLNFWCSDRQSLWDACRDIVLFWIARGVRTFRVDNPHTKPAAFWEWMIGEVQRDHPDVIFLSEAFTRPKQMKHLAKLGFTMSYTYFTWRNTASELRPYLEELTQSPMAEYFRGHLFVNTPDILTDYLVRGGPPAFRIRLLLAATLLPLYGIYSGFELFENVPVRPGSEEYLDSEKYQIKARDWDRADVELGGATLNAEIALVNRIRRENAALRQYANLTFHPSENPAVLFYRKAGARSDAFAPPTTPPSSSPPDILVAVTLDPHRPQETMVHVPIAEMGIGESEPYVVHDLLSGARYVWRGARNYVRLDPWAQVGHVLRIEERGDGRGRTEETTDRR